MNQSEFTQLNFDLARALEEKILEMDGDIRFEQASPNTWFFILSDGTHAPAEIYELYNDGTTAKWQYRGKEAGGK